MIAYHFTSMENWTSIRATGVVMRRPTEIGHDLAVWLTTEADPAEGIGIKPNSGFEQLRDFDQMDKSRVRIAVDLPRSATSKLRQWAIARGIPPQKLPGLSRIPGSGHWRLYRRDIPRELWRSVTDMKTGEPLPSGPTDLEQGPAQLDEGR